MSYIIYPQAKEKIQKSWLSKVLKNAQHISARGYGICNIIAKKNLKHKFAYLSLFYIMQEKNLLFSLFIF